MFRAELWALGAKSEASCRVQGLGFMSTALGRSTVRATAPVAGYRCRLGCRQAFPCTP